VKHVTKILLPLKGCSLSREGFQLNAFTLDNCELKIKTENLDTYFFCFYISVGSPFCCTTISDGVAQSPVMKRMSDTRWSAQAGATKALLHKFYAIKHILEGVSNNCASSHRQQVGAVA